MIRIPRPGYILRPFSAKNKRRKTTWSSSEIKAVLAHYDLGHWQIDHALSGGNSDNVLLQTKRGNKVLKRYFWSLPSTMQEHSILVHLAGTDFPSPRLGVNREGQTYTELGDKHYAIYDFVDGYCYADYFMPPRTKQRLVALAGETLAWFHQLLADFAPQGRKFNGFMPNGERLWRDVAWHLDILEQYVEHTAQKRTPDARDAFLLSIVDEIKGDLTEVGRHYEQANHPLPKQVIHGDYSPKNILFDHKGITAVLDLGDACVNLRALDVARGLTSFAQAGKYGVDERLARIFLLAYQVRQPLYESEIEAIPDLTQWRYLQNIVWKLFHTLKSPSNQQASSKHVAVLRNRWEQARWIKTHGNKLRGTLLRAIGGNI